MSDDSISRAVGRRGVSQLKEARTFKCERNLPNIADGADRSTGVAFGDDVFDNGLVAYVRIPVGHVGTHHHHKRSETVWYVMQGTLFAIVGNKRYRVGANQVTYMPAGVGHATGNGGDVEAQAIEVYAPSRGEGEQKDSYTLALPTEIVDAADE